MMMHDTMPIAVLISGSGSTLQNFIDLSAAGTLPVDICCVISSRPSARGLQRAADAGIATHVVQRRAHVDDLFSKQITDIVTASGAQLVCMAGFLSMWIIPPEFEHRVMNIHPALLPAFGGKGYYGLKVHQAVIDAGCTVSGCTVHFADNVYDHGPIILQRPVSVLDDDTPESLAERVMTEERVVYPEAIRLFAQGRLRVKGQRVLRVTA